MRIASGTTDQYIYFVAVDSTDLKTRETGLTSFTVYRSRNGGAASAYTTPTVNETDATNMPGVYELLLDEDMTIDAGDETQEIALHITQASMAPVTRVIELYRPKITAGNTLGVASDGDISGNLDGTVANVTTVTNLTNAPTSGDLTATMKASVNTEVDNSMVTYGLDHLISASVADTDVADNSIVAKFADSTAVTADYTNFDWTTDSFRAIRDHIGDGTNLTEAGGTGDQLTGITGVQLAADQAVNATKFGGATVTATTSVTFPASSTVATTTGAVGSVTGSVGSISGVTFPTNFGDLSITASTGRVDVASLAGQTAPVTNMELLFDSTEAFYTAYGGPRGPGVYLDDAAANTNTTNGVDGTIANPVSTIAAATTISDSLGVKRIYLTNDSDVTAAQTYADYEFVGVGYSMSNVFNVGDQIFTNCSFYNLALEGDVSASTGRFYAEGCILQDETGAGTSTFYIYANRCGFLDSFRVTNNDDHIFDQCFSMVAGNGTPTIDLNSGAAVDVNIRHYSGGLQIDNASATATMSVETDGQIVVDATCNSAFALTVRGNCSITDNATLSSLTTDAVYNRGYVNAEADTAISDATATIVDAVWDEDVVAAHNTSDTAGKKIGDMTFTKANELDVNTQSINGASVVGDGNATPWDGA